MNYAVLKIFSQFTILSNLRLPWKKQSCPENFHCGEYTFHIQEFWATCVCPEKQRGPWIHSIEYSFCYSGFWGTCTCPEKQSCPGIFHCIEIFFIIQDFWATCACPENRVCPEIFMPGGAADPRLVRLCHWLHEHTRLRQTRHVRGFIHLQSITSALISWPISLICQRMISADSGISFMSSVILSPFIIWLIEIAAGLISVSPMTCVFFLLRLKTYISDLSS